MASTIEAVPFSLRDAKFVIEAGTAGERDYSGTVSHVLFAPDVRWVDTTVYGAGPSSAITSVAWTLALEYPQDWRDASSLSLYLASHVGQERDVVFTPTSHLATHQVRARVVLAPGPIGGDAGPMLTGIVVMGVQDKPHIEEIPEEA